MEQANTINAPVVKALSLWAAIGVTSWSEAAAFVGFLYSAALLSEWLWKKVLRRLAERWGWVKPKSGEGR